tara:strand:- start:2351 stop:5500 length:3150 start_codon:yes stop_codon:yes gene_type:complete
LARSVSNVAIKVSVDDKDLQSLSNKFNKLEKEMKEARGKAAEMANAISKLGAELGRAKKKSKQVETSFQQMTKGVHGAALKFLFLKHAVTQVFHFIDGALSAVAEGAQLIDLRRNLSKSIVGFDQLMARAKTISRGMVSDEQLLRSAALMKQFGLEVGNLDRVTGVMAKTAVATGQNVDHMLDSFARGIARLSPLILDNLGISVSLKESYAAYAAQLGKATEELSKAEQMNALFITSLSELESKTKDIDLDKSFTAKIEAARVGVKDWVDDLKMAGAFIADSAAKGGVVKALGAEELGRSIENLRDLNFEMKVLAERDGAFGTKSIVMETVSAREAAILGLAAQIRDLNDVMTDLGRGGAQAGMDLFGASFNEVVESAIRGEGKFHALEARFRGIPDEIRKNEDAVKRLAIAFTSSEAGSLAMTKASEQLTKSMDKLENSQEKTATAFTIARERYRGLTLSAEKYSELVRNHVIRDVLGLDQALVTHSSILSGIISETDALSVVEQARNIHANNQIELESESAIPLKLEMIESLKDEIDKINGVSVAQRALTNAQRDLTAAQKAWKDGLDDGFGSWAKQLNVVSKLLSAYRTLANALKKVKAEEPKKGGASRQRLVEADVLQLKIEQLKTEFALGNLREKEFKFGIAKLKYEKEIAQIKKARMRKDLKEVKFAQAFEKHLQARAKIEADLAKKNDSFVRIAEMEDAKAKLLKEYGEALENLDRVSLESFGKSISGRASQLMPTDSEIGASQFDAGLSAMGDENAFNTLSKNLKITKDGFQEFIKAGEDWQELVSSVMEDEQLLKQLADAGISQQELLAVFDATAIGIKAAANEAKIFLEAMEGIDTVAGGLGLALESVSDGLNIIEQDFTAAQRAYDEAAAAGEGVSELAQLSADVDQADWDRFRLAMDMARESLSAIESSPDMLGKVQSGIQAIGMISSVFVDDMKKRALIMALMEAAQAAASFAAYDYAGGVAHTAAAVMFSAIAAGAIKPPQRPSGAGGPEASGGGGNRSATINVHMSGLTSLTQAEVGQQVYNAMGAAKSQGYIP